MQPLFWTRWSWLCADILGKKRHARSRESVNIEGGEKAFSRGACPGLETRDGGEDCDVS